MLLDGEIVITAGLPTHQRILDYIDAGKPLPIDITGGTLFHLGSYSREQRRRVRGALHEPDHQHALQPVHAAASSATSACAWSAARAGSTTQCAEAMQEVGCVYLSFLGGGSPLLSDAIKAVRQVAWDDLVSHYRLVKLRVEELGPLVVGIDSHGNSLFERLGQQARERMPEILRGLDEARAKRPVERDRYKVF